MHSYAMRLRSGEFLGMGQTVGRRGPANQCRILGPRPLTSPALTQLREVLNRTSSGFTSWSPEPRPRPTIWRITGSLHEV
jgi:hypothetical protein